MTVITTRQRTTHHSSLMLNMRTEKLLYFLRYEFKPIVETAAKKLWSDFKIS